VFPIEEKTLRENLLTVVVPTRDRGDISECLERLAGQNYRPLEIRVIDQSAQETTAESCAPFLKRQDPPFFLHRTDTAGLDRARNLGLQQSEGEWIAFVDDDCLVEPGWAQAIVAAFRKHPKAGMVFGKTLPFHLPEEGKRTRISIKDWPQERVLASRFSLFNTSAGMGGNMSISRACYEASGGFDPDLDVGTDLPGAGDLERTYRALAGGFEAVYTPEAVALHKRWLNEEDYQRTEAGYAKGRAASWVKAIKAGDILALAILKGEFAGRLAEVPYHLLLKRDRANTRRAIGRLRGFASGMLAGLEKSWGGTD
jgi:glycosyltransferase involved in cell wall biosynthesis